MYNRWPDILGFGDRPGLELTGDRDGRELVKVDVVDNKQLHITAILGSGL